MGKKVLDSKPKTAQKSFMIFFISIVGIMLAVILANDVMGVDVKNIDMYHKVFLSSVTLIAGYLFGSNSRM